MVLDDLSMDNKRAGNTVTYRYMERHICDLDYGSWSEVRSENKGYIDMARVRGSFRSRGFKARVRGVDPERGYMDTMGPLQVMATELRHQLACMYNE